LALTGLAAGALAEQSGRGTLPAQVKAVYRISFTALGDIGHFRFQSNIDGGDYALTADAKIDTAIFDYRGDMKSRGGVYGAVTEPAAYDFSYKQKTFLKKKKVKSLNIAFAGDSVSKVTPADPLSPKAVPVTKSHLKQVLDPLSGVMALSLGNLSRPCDQKLPIYDGKQRFDLVFTPHGRSGGDHVCHVKLVPVAGHKPNSGMDSVISGNIEVVLRPVPKANVIIPYRVTVPTVVGSAVLTSERVDITMPDKERIALGR
jgi:hypothetical protein